MIRLARYMHECEKSDFESQVTRLVTEVPMINRNEHLLENSESYYGEIFGEKPGNFKEFQFLG